MDLVAYWNSREATYYSWSWVSFGVYRLLKTRDGETWYDEKGREVDVGFCLVYFSGGPLASEEPCGKLVLEQVAYWDASGGEYTAELDEGGFVYSPDGETWTTWHNKPVDVVTHGLVYVGGPKNGFSLRKTQK